MRPRFIAICCGSLLLIAGAFLVTRELVRAKGQGTTQELTFLGFQTNMGVVEAVFRFTANSLVPLDQLNFDMFRELQGPQGWRKDSTWRPMIRADGDRKATTLYIQAPAGGPLWRLSVKGSIKPFIFPPREFHFLSPTITNLTEWPGSRGAPLE